MWNIHHRYSPTAAHNAETLLEVPAEPRMPCAPKVNTGSPAHLSATARLSRLLDFKGRQIMDLPLIPAAEN